MKKRTTCTLLLATIALPLMSLGANCQVNGNGTPTQVNTSCQTLSVTPPPGMPHYNGDNDQLSCQIKTPDTVMISSLYLLPENGTLDPQSLYSVNFDQGPTASKVFPLLETANFHFVMEKVRFFTGSNKTKTTEIACKMSLAS